MARIPIQFTGLTSNANHKDGECSNIVNLRPKDGYLKPVSPRKIEHELSQEYDLIFIHRGNDYENWIGVRGYTIYNNINTGSVGFIGSSINEKVNSIQQIGNTLSFITDKGIYYCLYKNNDYKFLGELPGLPSLGIGARSKQEIKKFFSTDYPSEISSKDGAILDYTQAIVNSCIDTFANGGKVGDTTVEAQMLFYDAHLLRYGFRLYDGSIVKHSSPLLIMPYGKIEELKQIAFWFKENDNIRTNASFVTVTGYNLGLHVDLSYLTDWKDVITSVDLFLSPALGFSNINNLSKDKIQQTVDEHLAYSNQGGVQEAVPIFKDLLPESIKQLQNESRFYFIKSFDVGVYINPLDPLIFPTSEPDIAKFDNLPFQELMPVDSLSHHKYGAKTSLAYNNRIRISNIQTTFFKGFNLDHFDWDNSYNGTLKPEGAVQPVMIETELAVNNRIEYVYSAYSEYGGTAFHPFMQSYLSYPDTRAKKMHFYLMTNASTWKLIFTAELKPHTSLNIAFYIHPDLQPINNIVGSSIAAKSGTHDKVTLLEGNKIKLSEVNNPFFFPNVNTYQIGAGKILNESSIVMNVSDRNYGMYPVFVFTDNGVFTMSGQTSDTAHESVQAPTYLEPPISPVICATPHGVCFVTKRGLMMINQHETTFLSPQLHEVDDVVVIHDINEMPSDVIHYPAISFLKFLETIDGMLYNPYNDELIISSANSDYNYVYDFPSKSFYMSTETFTGLVQNSFPDIYVADGMKIKDYSQSQTKATNISLITRPLSFGTTDIKTLERVWLRTLLYNTTAMSVAAFHSLDGVNFFPIKGVMFGQKHGNYLDVDLGLLARETYKHYMLLFTGTVDEETQIKYAEFEVKKRYSNEKMR